MTAPESCAMMALTAPAAAQMQDELARLRQGPAAGDALARALKTH